MQMFRRTRLALSVAVAGAAFAATSGGASAATCSPMGDDAGPAYGVRICGAGDVDQFRPGLVNDGNAYCGPTSLYNVLHYMRNVKGVPIRVMGMFDDLTLDGIDPLDPADYSPTTNRLYGLGVMAKTDKDGSTSDNNRAAFDDATSYARGQGWKTSTGSVSSSTTPEFGLEIAKRLKTGPLQLWYGRYGQGPYGYIRDGGHAVTVIGAFGTTGTNEVELYLYDPGRAADHKVGNYLNTQSPYRVEVVKLKKVTINVNTSGFESQKRTYWELTGTNYQGSTRQMVESFNWFTATK